MWPRFMLEAVRRGSVLANLLPSHTSRWWPLVEDVFHSQQSCLLRTSILKECTEHQEFTTLSIDGTFKICLSLLGQVPFNAPKKRRAEAAFRDEDSIRRVITVRGKTGAVVAMFGAAGEGSDHIAEGLQKHLSKESLIQVCFVATDAPSRRLFCKLKEILPNLRGLLLDPLRPSNALRIVFSPQENSRFGNLEALPRKVFDAFALSRRVLHWSALPFNVCS